LVNLQPASPQEVAPADEPAVRQGRMAGQTGRVQLVRAAGTPASLAATGILARCQTAKVE
jgi:hypothetical protein